MLTLIVTAYAYLFPPNRLSAHLYLWKPVRVRELLSVVARVLGGEQL